MMAALVHPIAGIAWKIAGPLVYVRSCVSLLARNSTAHHLPIHAAVAGGLVFAKTGRVLTCNLRLQRRHSFY